MATQLKDAPGTLVNTVITGVAWSNPGNATSSNDSYATTPNFAGSTDALDITNFGFTVPTGATIDDLKVEVECKASAGFTATLSARILGGPISPSTQSRVLGGSFVGTSDAYLSTNAVPNGGAATWQAGGVTDAHTNASTFGVRLVAHNGTKSNVIVSVDHVRITITYTGGAAGGSLPPRRRSTRFFKVRG